MTQKINTGSYRICRNQTGIGNSIQVLEVGDRNSIDESWQTMEKNPEFNYYREEEVIYRGSQFDQYRNPIDSAPAWVRY